MQETEFVHIYVLLHVPGYLVDVACSFYRFTSQAYSEECVEKL